VCDRGFFLAFCPFSSRSLRIPPMCVSLFAVVFERRHSCAASFRASEFWFVSTFPPSESSWVFYPSSQFPGVPVLPGESRPRLESLRFFRPATLSRRFTTWSDFFPALHAGAGHELLLRPSGSARFSCSLILFVPA